MADERDLRYKIGADDSEARKVLDGFARKLEETNKKAGSTDVTKSIGRGLSELSTALPVEGLSRFAAIFTAAGPFAVGAAVVGGLALAVKSLVGEIDDLDDAAQGLGTTAIALADLRIGAKQAGVDAGTLARALNGLNIKAAEAAAGNEQAGAAFARFGIDVRDAAGKIKPTEALLGELSDSVKQFANDADRAQGLADIFGAKLGPRLAAFLAEGSEGLRVASGLTQQMVDDAVKAQREIDKLAAAWDRLKFAVGGYLAQQINSLGAGRALDGATLLAPDAFIRDAQAGLLKAEQDLERAKRLATRGPSLAERFLGGSPQEELRKAQDTVDRLRAIIEKTLSEPFDQLGVGLPILDVVKQSLPKGDDLALLQRNQTALAQYVQTLQGLIDASEELTQVQRVQRAIAQNQFGNLTAESKQAAQLLLQLAAAADRATEQRGEQQRREGFAAFVQQIEATVVAMQKLTNAERVELFLSQNPRSARSEQEKEAARAIARRADEQERLNRLLAEQTAIDEQTRSTFDAEEKRTQELRQRITELSGIAADMQKIRLTETLEKMLGEGVQFDAAQLDRIVKGIAGISDEAEKTDSTLRDLGLTFTSAFEAAAAGGEKGSDIIKGLGRDLAQLSVRKYLTQPFLEFLDTLESKKGSVNWLQLLLEAFNGTGRSSGGGASAGAPAGTGFTDDLAGGIGAQPESNRGGARIASAKGGITIIQHNTFTGVMASDERRQFAAEIQAKTLAAAQEQRQRNPAFA